MKRIDLDVPVPSLEPASFKVFYDAVLPAVYRFFMFRCGGRRDVAADLTQKTFESAIRSLRNGAEVETPMPWIMTIARRRLIDHYRTTDMAEVLMGEVPEPPTDAWRGIPSIEEVRLVSAFHRLSATYRLALSLRYLDELPVAEVASHLGRSLRATESLLVRARSALETEYAEACDE